MSIKAGLTSADLEEIRHSALGAADPLGIAADLAAAADDGRLAEKNDAGYALTLAAEIAESRAKLDAALRYADRAVDAFGAREDSQVGAARALRARILFRAGREDEAMAGLEPLRPLLTQHPDAAAYLSAALAAGRRHAVAEEWLTEAVQTVLNQRNTTPSAVSIQPAVDEESGLLFFLLQQRHRIRHQLGRSHDQHDNLAERLETRLANANSRTTAEPADDLLFWPQAEFDRLRDKWPALAEAYGTDFDGHRAHLERELVRLTGLGRTGLGPIRGTVAGLTSFAGRDGDPAEPASRAGYAQRLADASATISWPPERNGSCWCGSGAKYKKCCLPRAR